MVEMDKELDERRVEYVRLCFEMWKDIRLYIKDNVGVDARNNNILTRMGNIKEIIYRRGLYRYLDMGFNPDIVRGIWRHSYCPCCMENAPCNADVNNTCLLRGIWERGCLSKGSPYLNASNLLLRMRCSEDKDKLIREIDIILAECVRIINSYNEKIVVNG